MIEESDPNSLAYFKDLRAGRFRNMGGLYALYTDGKFVLAWKPYISDSMRQTARELQERGALRKYNIERIPF